MTRRLVPEYFVELFDRERGEFEFSEYRSATAALRIQVHEFFDGLQVAFPRDSTEDALRQSTSEVTRLMLDFHDEHEPHPMTDLNSSVAEIFHFMYELNNSIQFNHEFGAGYAPDGSWTMVVGFEMPLLPSDGFTESVDYDDRKIAQAFYVAKRATLLLAMLAAEKDREDD